MLLVEACSSSVVLTIVVSRILETLLLASMILFLYLIQFSTFYNTIIFFFFTATPPSNCPEKISWSALCSYLKMFMVTDHMRLWRTWLDDLAHSVTEGHIVPYLTQSTLPAAPITFMASSRCRLSLFPSVSRQTPKTLSQTLAKAASSNTNTARQETTSHAAPTPATLAHVILTPTLPACWEETTK